MSQHTQLSIDQLDIHLGGQPILEGVSLDLAQGEIGCLLGPSGCGKTTLLRCIAGFEQPLAGRITLGGQAVADHRHTVPVERRHVGMVFQDFALFPHLSVADNIGFGLKGQKRERREARVDELLQLVGLAGHRHHYPHEISGGQQQRVALARALATKPDILLLDEPFSSMDNALREQLARSVREILKTEGVTALMVTHDQLEAFAIADVVGVMSGGALLQWGTAYELYHQPASRFVANFVGRGTFIHGETSTEGRVQTALGELPCPPGHCPVGQAFDVLVRPDDIIHDDDSHWRATIIGRSFHGAHFLYRLKLDSGEEVLCYAPSHHNHRIGEAIGIRHEADHIVAFAASH
ncbi:MAG: ABC transporter ATP-binding protein [Pseudomonadota bacterium]